MSFNLAIIPDTPPLNLNSFIGSVDEKANIKVTEFVNSCFSEIAGIDNDASPTINIDDRSFYEIKKEDSEEYL